MCNGSLFLFFNMGTIIEGLLPINRLISSNRFLPDFEPISTTISDRKLTRNAISTNERELVRDFVGINTSHLINKRETPTQRRRFGGIIASIFSSMLTIKGNSAAAAQEKDVEDRPVSYSIAERECQNGSIVAGT